MSKKVFSIFACFLILFSVIGFGKNFKINPIVSAAVSQPIKSFSQLSTEHEKFIYIGTEFYEPGSDNSYSELTDHAVTPGMKLKVKVYIKTDLYTGTGMPGFTFDNRFFDIQNGTGEYDKNITAVANANHADLSAAGVTVRHTGMMLSNVPVVKAGKLLVTDKSVGDDYVLSVQDMSVQYAGYLRDVSSRKCFECNEDEYFYEFYVTVRDDLANGTCGVSFADPVMYSFYKNVDSAVAVGTPPFDVKTTDNPDADATNCKMMSAMGFDESNVLLDDSFHFFTVGDTAIEPVTRPTEPATKPVEPTGKPSIKPTEPEQSTEPEESTAATTEPTTNKPSQPGQIPDEPTTDNLFDFEIRQPKQTVINYGDSLILYADFDESLPLDYDIVWNVKNSNFSIVQVSVDGKMCTVTPKDDGPAVISATVYDDEGHKVVSDECTVTAKANLIYKIIGFFKKLFNLTKLYS